MNSNLMTYCCLIFLVINLDLTTPRKIKHNSRKACCTATFYMIQLQMQKVCEVMIMVVRSKDITQQTEVHLVSVKFLLWDTESVEYSYVVLPQISNYTMRTTLYCNSGINMNFVSHFNVNFVSHFNHMHTSRFVLCVCETSEQSIYSFLHQKLLNFTYLQFFKHMLISRIMVHYMQWEAVYSSKTSTTCYIYIFNQRNKIVI